MINAGDLDRRVELLRATSTRDGMGGKVEFWSVLATVWASRRDLTDVERERADQLGAKITTRFVIRWSPEVADLNAKDRVRDLEDGRLCDIEGVRDLGRREAREISAKLLGD